MPSLTHIIPNEAHWTTRYSARDEQDHSVSPCSGFAVCFCILGAIGRAFHEQPDYVMVRAHEMMRRIIAEMDTEFNTNQISKWNDDPKRTFSEVEAVLKEFDKQAKIDPILMPVYLEELPTGEIA